MKNTKGHLINTVKAGGIAEEMGISTGDTLLAVNGHSIEDIFDYQYYTEDDYIEVLIKKPDGSEWLLEIDKDPDEDLGIEFDNGLMDEYKSCHNRCIFCFIDQMPKGMRDTLYFKDDDSRLSFLQGNYVTLTNMSDDDIERIIKYNLSPINISFQTTNPELRCRMLGNRFAGEALKKAKRLRDAGITMNGQIVLCKGINDGEELNRSISDLSEYIPVLESVSVVPVGLSRFRENLYPLEPFDREDALSTLELIHSWQNRLYVQHGTHFVHASDEWYSLAGLPMPEEERYDGYLQLENGVGMLRLLYEEFMDALSMTEDDASLASIKRDVSIATGMLAYPYIKKLCDLLHDRAPQLNIILYPIRNDFFGENITVSGLLTGQDVLKQLKDRELGEALLLPQNVLRSGEEVFLDDMTLTELSDALQVPVNIVKSSGYDFMCAVTGTDFVCFSDR